MWIFSCSYLLRYLLSSGVSTAGSTLRPSFFAGILELEPQNLETKGKLKGRAWGTLSRFTPQSFIGKAYFVDTASDTCTLPLNPINITSVTLSFSWITSRIFLIDAILYQHLPLIQYNSYCIIITFVPLNRESD